MLDSLAASDQLSACPLKAGVPLEVSGMILVNDTQASSIPELALSIPDFEGQAIIRIFSNTTRAEIGCFTAQITNGNTFQQIIFVGPTLAIFTFLAILSSFATVVYGDDPIVIRKHYAHSLSVLIVFSVWHHVFYTGALSVNWPSILVAFWSNYAWAGGMIYSPGIQDTINAFVGANKGNISVVGAAGTGTRNPTLGGGYNLQQIYKRALSGPIKAVLLAKRDPAESADGFVYTGQPAKTGLPLPGNYSGFAGTLAQVGIPASNAFMTGFIWFLTFMAFVIACILAFKLILELLRKIGFPTANRLDFFRWHSLRYLGAAILRTVSVGFFMLAFLTMFQFSYLNSRGPILIASLLFIAIVLGLGGFVGVAGYQRIKSVNYILVVDRLKFERTKVLRFLPWFSISRKSRCPRPENRLHLGSIPWWTIECVGNADSIHNDVKYMMNFGWLAARYRRTRWWFFIFWVIYEFIRAGIMAGASQQPRIQVFGLLIVEVVALIATILLRPFEGQRLNLIVNYLLGISKVATVALSALFEARFGLPRILATIIGIVIIIIQGLLTFVVLMAILLGAITSYMSVMRNHETVRPNRWNPSRRRYFEHMDFAAEDIPRPQPLPNDPVADVRKSPYFNVNHVKRVAKVEDEDPEFMQEIRDSSSVVQLPLSGLNRNVARDSVSIQGVAASIQSQTSYSNLPKAARPHRASWSSMVSRHPTTAASTLVGSYRYSSTAHLRASTPNEIPENPENDSSVFNGSMAPSVRGPHERWDILMPPSSRRRQVSEPVLPSELEAGIQRSNQHRPATSMAENR